MVHEFGALLRRLRAQTAITQEDLAERSGVSVSTIRRLENGRAGDPRVGTVRLLADALDVTGPQRRSLLAVADHGGVEPPQDEPLRDEPEPQETSASASLAQADHPPPGSAPTTLRSPTPPTGADLPAALPDRSPPTRPRGRSTLRANLDDAADRLAHHVHSRWQREEELRVDDPGPLPIRWRPVAASAEDPLDPEPRPGPITPETDLIDDLSTFAEIFRREPPGRLVVLGRAGSGKTILSIRFVLDRLRDTTNTGPVPVIFSLGSWDPTTSTLRDWMSEQLLRDDPGLSADSGAGSTLAAALVEAGRILPVLDGFDEITEGMHSIAMAALRSTKLPMLVTSRPEAYHQAVAADGALSPVVVRLADLATSDFVDYLQHSHRPARVAAAWEPVLTALRSRPQDAECANLAAALNTPLMADLARRVYDGSPGRDPGLLLDVTRFPTSEDIEEDLVSGLVPVVYGPKPGVRRNPNWTTARVQRWFGHLACHLDRLATPDLAWWRLADALSPSTRILGVVVATTLVAGALEFLLVLSLTLIFSDRGLWQSILVSLLDAALLGPLVGLGAGIIYGLLVVLLGNPVGPSRVRMRLSGHTWAGLARALPVVVPRVGNGLLGGFIIGLGFGPVGTLGRGLVSGLPPTTEQVISMTLINSLLYAIIFGVAVGAVLGVMAALETPLDLATVTGPASMLASNRRIALRQALIVTPLLTLAIGSVGAAMAGLFESSLGPLKWGMDSILITGGGGGVMGAACYCLGFTAWGQWLALTRIWLPLTGRVPWPVMTFLADAHRRGILRRTGVVYQFRHARFHRHFARMHAQRTGERVAADVGSG
ncbi:MULTISPECIES: helix-turn-helix domain-containing protein [Actinoalloteichus]|uniref:NACHT domain/Helix-turn-helix domain n=1 Tax=Actinoalloteichus fjordicus TaxID=1612552 RepID=A0AAC9LFG3_9PSEU|nr:MULTISPECIES: helix-turn-helix domain-containing protein [Actinoalloteichus]APU15894.1 NACHT domain/Helix-turn-helix domain [Actinoalloteichus fjordicus]APU21956.1 NACHT domain/Helix-turn-helix domain [Actinoalloteichus sp. GBA129-24]